MKTFKQFQEDYTRVINPVKPVTDLIGAGLGAYELGKKAFSGLSNIFQAKKKNYGINLRVNRKAKKDDYYDGGEGKEKKKIQDKITKKDKRDVDKANKKMLKDITQKSNNPELEKNPVYQQLNRPTDTNQFVAGKKIDAKTRRRMDAPENQFNSYDPLKEEAPTNNVGGGQIAGTVEAGDDPPVKKGRKKKKSKKKRYIYGGTGSRKMWMKKNNK